MERASGRLGSRQRGMPMAHGGAALLLVGLLAGCYPGPRDPVGLPLPPSPFVRAPYVQAVGAGSAWVLWMARGERDDTAFLRPRHAPEAGWRSVPVEPHGARSRKAKLAPLPPGAEIEYIVSVGGTRAGPYVFRTAPSENNTADDDANRPVRVLAFGDSGWGSEEQVRLARLMSATEWDLAIHMGDIAYEDGRESELTYRHFRVYSNLLARTPFYPAPGNHDVRSEKGAPYDAAFLWDPPYPGARYHAFRWGDVLFVALDTSSPTEDVKDLRRGRGRQYLWLATILQGAAADPRIRWTVVYMHHPVYSHALGISGHGYDRDLHNHLVPLFEHFGVDLVAAGHDHHYGRLQPVRDGRPVEEGCGPVYLLTGGGGASQYARDVRPSALSARLVRAYHFVGLQIERERMTAEVIDADGRTIDLFEVRAFPGTGRTWPGGCAE